MDLVEQFWHTIERAVEEDGVYPHWGLYLAPGEGGEVALTIVAIDLRDPAEIIHLAHTWIEVKSAVEVVFGLDRYTKVGQGNEFGDCITVYHWREDQPWRYGVIDYRPPPEKVVRPIDWEHAFWTGALADEHRRWAARFRPLTIRVKMADGTESLLGLEGLR